MPDDQDTERLHTLDESDSRLQLPDATHLYLIDCLVKMGAGRPSALETHYRNKKTYLYRNFSPLSFQEIRTWCDFTGVELTPWEAETLRVLSEAYVVQLNNSRDVNCEPPHDARSLEEMRERTHNQFQRLFKQVGGKTSG